VELVIILLVRAGSGLVDEFRRGRIATAAHRRDRERGHANKKGPTVSTAGPFGLRGEGCPRFKPPLYLPGSSRRVQDRMLSTVCRSHTVLKSCIIWGPVHDAGHGQSREHLRVIITSFHRKLVIGFHRPDHLHFADVRSWCRLQIAVRHRHVPGSNGSLHARQASAASAAASAPALRSPSYDKLEGLKALIEV
jgi:hypothetical protein